MNTHKDRATVLRLYPLGETGLIVVWATREHGIIRTAARQARKMGSAFFGHIDLFYDCEIIFSFAKSGDLHRLVSVSLQHARLKLRKTLGNLRLASYMTRLLQSTVEEGESDTAWYLLIAGALDYLNDHAASRAIMRHFEKRLSALHGLYVEGAIPHATLLRHFERLPDGREALWRSLS